MRTTAGSVSIGKCGGPVTRNWAARALRSLTWVTNLALLIRDDIASIANLLPRVEVAIADVIDMERIGIGKLTRRQLRPRIMKHRYSPARYRQPRIAPSGQRPGRPD